MQKIAIGRISLQILDPFKVAEGHATGIRQNIRHHCNATIIENAIRIWSSRTVCRLNNQARFYSCSIFYS